MPRVADRDDTLTDEEYKLPILHIKMVAAKRRRRDEEGEITAARVRQKERAPDVLASSTLPVAKPEVMM